jgi:soluble lytic murein transglycosylase-like protein
VVAAAADSSSPGSQSDTQRQAARLTAAARAVDAASAALDRLRARPAAAVAIDQLRQDLQLARAQFAFREAIRAEQAVLYEVAGRPDLEPAILPLLNGPHAAGTGQVTAGLRSVWRLTGIDASISVRPRNTHRFSASEPPEVLLGYYRAAAARTGVEWSYLAAINYLESDFGRVNGPSSAGALGPMQFLPSTWRDYGGGGDIMSPHDSIQAAALLLARNGAPGDYDRAILRYNRDDDYVAAVKSYAAALRSDPFWLLRFYYWSTFG